MKAGFLVVGISVGVVLVAGAAERASTRVRARVIGPEGKPIAGAVVKPYGVGAGSSTRWGGRQGFPGKLETDTNGEFVLSRAEPFSRVQAKISMAGLAPANVWLEATGGVATVHLGLGATIQGRLLKNGRPLAGVRLGVAGAERSAEVFAGNYETTSGEDGRFRFQHLPPHTAWWLCPVLSSMKAHGTIVFRPVQSGADGETTEVGDVPVIPALHLAGVVKTRHGERLPKKFRVRLSYDKAWTGETVAVDSRGRFRFEGLAAGLVNISLASRGWHFSPANRSLDLWNSWQLVGLLEESKDDLQLVVEPGKSLFSGGGMGNGQLPSQDWPQARPLAGAEPSGPPPIVLAGRVLDDKTGRPVSRYKVVPGYKPPSMPAPAPSGSPLRRVLESFRGKTVPFNERPFWEPFRAETMSNSVFAVGFVPLSSTPMLRIEAQGYQAFETEPMGVTTSNLVIRLKPGAGPNGIVLLPDGKPAEGASVVYAVRGEQVSLKGKSLGSYGEKRALQVTGKDGRFSFADRSQGMTLFVSHPAGWAEESVEDAGDKGRITLRPWAAIAGTLVDSNGVPKAGVSLGLTMPHDWQRGDPFINFQDGIKTDAQGNFFFAAVPPRRLEVNRLVPVATSGSHGWTCREQTWLVAQPGITNGLGKVTYDQPPPPPVFEQLKRKLGL